MRGCMWAEVRLGCVLHASFSQSQQHLLFPSCPVWLFLHFPCPSQRCHTNLYRKLNGCLFVFRLVSQWLLQDFYSHRSTGQGDSKVRINKNIAEMLQLALIPKNTFCYLFPKITESTIQLQFYCTIYILSIQSSMIIHLATEQRVWEVLFIKNKSIQWISPSQNLWWKLRGKKRFMTGSIL